MQSSGNHTSAWLWWLPDKSPPGGTAVLASLCPKPQIALLLVTSWYKLSADHGRVRRLWGTGGEMGRGRQRSGSCCQQRAHLWACPKKTTWWAQDQAITHRYVKIMPGQQAEWQRDQSGGTHCWPTAHFSYAPGTVVFLSGGARQFGH